jgi:lipopolysaccharide biosynthesis glycosyltransferase
MKKLVLTIAIGDKYQQMALITHPFIHGYASKIGADFHAITRSMISLTTPHWEKFRIHDLLDQYDRIIYLDTDIIVKPDCQDLFEIVPYHQIGAYNEGRHFARSRQDYWNTGVMVLSKHHRDLFTPPAIMAGDINTFFEQDTLNHTFAAWPTMMYDLPREYNALDGGDGYIIHKAGNLNALAELKEIASCLGIQGRENTNGRAVTNG